MTTMIPKSGRPLPSPPLNSRLRPLLTSNPAILLLVSLGFILGFLSGYSSPSSTPPPSPLPQAPATRLPPPQFSAAAASPPPHDLLRFRTKCSPPLPHSEILPTILRRLYNGSSPYAGFPSPYTSSLLLPPPLHPRGWGSTGAVFADLISAVRPSTIIELGTFLGASALHMASLTRNLSLPGVPAALILCLDDFRGWPGFNAGKLRRDLPTPHHADALLLHQFMANVARAGESDRVVPLPFSTGSALAALCEWGVYGDLIEVDAGHDFHSAWADINMAWAVLRPGGVLFGHDYHTVADDRGVRRAVTLFAKVKGLTAHPHGQHWVLSPKPTAADQ